MALSVYGIGDGSPLATGAASVEVSATIRRIIFLQQQDAWTIPLCQELVAALHQLLELIESCFSLEENYGYFEDPALVGGSYGDRVSEMQEEHQALAAELSWLCEDASRLLRSGGLPYCADAIMARFYAFCDQLVAHQLREKVLISDALSIDIGCLD